MTMSLKPQNILCQRISESEVVPVVCDNLGKVPLSRWRHGQHGAVNANWRECGSGLSPSLRWPLPREGRAAKRQETAGAYFSRSLMACAYQARTTQIAGRIRRSRRHSTKLIKLVARHKRFPTQLAHLAHNPRLPATHIAGRRIRLIANRVRQHSRQ